HARPVGRADAQVLDERIRRDRGVDGRDAGPTALLDGGAGGALPLRAALGQLLPPPHGDGAPRDPRDDAVGAELGRGLDGLLVAAAGREGLHQRETGQTLHGRGRVREQAQVERLLAGGGDLGEDLSAGGVGEEQLLPHPDPGDLGRVAALVAGELELVSLTGGGEGLVEDQEAGRGGGHWLARLRGSGDRGASRTGRRGSWGGWPRRRGGRRSARAARAPRR